MAAYPFGHTAFGGAPNDAAINCNSSYSERPYYRKREKKKFRRFFFFFLVFPQSQKKNIPDIMVLLIIILQWYNQLPKHQFLDRKKLLPTTTKSWRRFVFGFKQQRNTKIWRGFFQFYFRCTIPQCNNSICIHWISIKQFYKIFFKKRKKIKKK